MQELIEIVRVLVQRRVRDIDIFGEKVIRDREKRYCLYQGIKEGHYTTDNNAAAAIYSADKSDVRYQQLKSRLRKQLLEALLRFDMKAAEQTQYQIAVYECTKGITYARILVTNGAWTAALSLANELLARAMTFQLTDIALQSLMILRDYEARRGGMKNYEKYNQQLKEIIKRMEVEILSDELMNRFMLIYGKTVSDKPDNVEEMRELTQSMEATWRNAATFTTTLNYFRAEIYFNMSVFRYREASAFCREAHAYLGANPHLSSNPRLGEFAGLAVLCNIHERNYTVAEEVIGQYIHCFVEGTGNWGLFMSSCFLVAIHTEKYAEAADILLKVLNHRGFMGFSPLQQEKWNIYRMFLEYVVRIGWAAIPEQLEKELGLGARWYEHLNNLSMASKDKKGMNIILYILQTLFILEEAGLEGGYTRLEPLRQYANIHLKNTEYPRSNAFLKMLFILIDSELDIKKAEKRGQKYHELLMLGEGDGHRRMEGLEVIPYEKLWEIVVWRVPVWRE